MTQPPIAPLELRQLVAPEEKTYFTVSVCLAVLISLLFFFIVIPAGLVLGIIGFLTHGLLIGRLRSESVRITAEQHPELYDSFLEVCKRLQVDQVPEFYLLQAGGILNAYATRHAGRNFVVIYSSFVEILGVSSPMVKFLIGHEIGHIQRKHLLKKVLLAPAFIFPLIQEAYSRACETTCDRYGAFASADPQASALTLAVLGAGREATHLDLTRYAQQSLVQRGFFVSWHELISTYPTLSQRVARMLALQDPAFRRQGSRSIFAYPFATIFNLRVLILVYFFGVLLIPILQGMGASVKRAEAMQRLQQEHDAVPGQ